MGWHPSKVETFRPNAAHSMTGSPGDGLSGEVEGVRELFSGKGGCRGDRCWVDGKTRMPVEKGRGKGKGRVAKALEVLEDGLRVRAALPEVSSPKAYCSLRRK